MPPECLQNSEKAGNREVLFFCIVKKVNYNLLFRGSGSEFSI